MIARPDAARLVDEIETLAGISQTPYPDITRIVFSDVDMASRAWLKERCVEAGLAVREDAVGNMFARWSGTRGDLTPIATGSHIDAIPNAGRFDGVVGVLGGLEALRALRRAGFTPTRSIDLVMFTAEEPTRFGIGCVGSRLLGGESTTAIAALRDADGVTLDEARRAAGFSGELDSVALEADGYAAFVELHIEQGPLLEADGVPIGIVTAIAAPATLAIAFSGPGGHAGGVLMPDRHDPLLAAATTILAIDRAARATGSLDTVATCGVVDVHPGAVNSIPRRAAMRVDVRDVDEARRDRVIVDILAAARAAADTFGVALGAETLNADPPAACGDEIRAAIAASCVTVGVQSRAMVSRAYHDALFMARICPTGMIFVPCRGGVSHRPDEYASPEDIGTGVSVLAGALATLSG